MRGRVLKEGEAGEGLLANRSVRTGEWDQERWHHCSVCVCVCAYT